METQSSLKEKDQLINRLKNYQRTLKGQLTGLQTELKGWVKKYGRMESLMKKNGGDDK